MKRISYNVNLMKHLCVVTKSEKTSLLHLLVRSAEFFQRRRTKNVNTNETTVPKTGNFIIADSYSN